MSPYTSLDKLDLYKKIATNVPAGHHGPSLGKLTGLLPKTGGKASEQRAGFQALNTW